MSDSEHSTVTYTSVSFPVEDDSDIGSPGVDGPPIMPEDPYAYIMAAYEVPPSPDYIPGPEVPPSPDYIPGPEVPPSPDYIPGPEEPQSPPPLDFVPEPMYPEYMPQEDEILPAKEQPLPAAASPTADLLGYVPESDLKEEPEEDDEDPEEDPADYPADGDDDDDEDKDEDEDKEEEEHPAPADSVPPVHRMTARISIWDEPSISLPPREEVERLLALTTPPPSPLTPLSSPLPQIPSPPLPIPSPPPNSPTHIEIPESCLPLWKRVRFASPTPSHEVGESSAAGAARQDRPAIARDDPYSIAREDLYGFVDMVDVPPRCSTSRELDYGITDTWDDLVGAIDEIAPTTLEGVNQRVTDLATIVEQETTIMDRPFHRRLAVMIEREAKMAREAWGLSMDSSDYACSDVMSLRTIVVAQSALISELQSADHKRQRLADCIEIFFWLFMGRGRAGQRGWAREWGSGGLAFSSGQRARGSGMQNASDGSALIEMTAGARGPREAARAERCLRVNDANARVRLWCCEAGAGVGDEYGAVRDSWPGEGSVEHTDIAGSDELQRGARGALMWGWGGRGCHCLDRPSERERARLICDICTDVAYILVTDLVGHRLHLINIEHSIQEYEYCEWRMTMAGDATRFELACNRYLILADLLGITMRDTPGGALHEATVRRRDESCYADITRALGIATADGRRQCYYGGGRSVGFLAYIIETSLSVIHRSCYAHLMELY
ncbi:hypothetical protein Tco_0002846 [Tanacetum coccineum]